MKFVSSKLHLQPKNFEKFWWPNSIYAFKISLGTNFCFAFVTLTNLVIIIHCDSESNFIFEKFNPETFFVWLMKQFRPVIQSGKPSFLKREVLFNNQLTAFWLKHN